MSFRNAILHIPFESIRIIQCVYIRIYYCTLHDCMYVLTCGGFVCLILTAFNDVNDIFYIRFEFSDGKLVFKYIMHHVIEKDLLQ